MYRGYDSRMSREVAIKRIATSVGDPSLQEESTKQLVKEAGALASLQHPHIVTIYDVGSDEDGPYVVMELINGKTLDELIEKAPLTWQDFRELAMQTQEALIAAQELDLIHSDLKPSNLMLTWLPSGKFQVKIVDFGLATLTQSQSAEELETLEAVFGSIFFMPPEQFERKPLDARSDLYSMGCVYYQALTGICPFNGETGAEVMAAHLHHTVTPIQDLRSDIPMWACDWIMWQINRLPEDRPESARDSLSVFLQNDKNPNPTMSLGSAGAANTVKRPRLIIPGSEPVSAAGVPVTTATASVPIDSPAAVEQAPPQAEEQPAPAAPTEAAPAATAAEQAPPKAAAKPMLVVPAAKAQTAAAAEQAPPKAAAKPMLVVPGAKAPAAAAAEQAPLKSAAKPLLVVPAAASPVVPAATDPVVEPAVVEPAAVEPAVEPAAVEPAVEPAAVEPAVEPATPTEMVGVAQPSKSKAIPQPLTPPVGSKPSVHTSAQVLPEPEPVIVPVAAPSHQIHVAPVVTKAEKFKLSNAAKTMIAAVIALLVVLLAWILLNRSAQNRQTELYNTMINQAAKSDATEVSVNKVKLEILLEAVANTGIVEQRQMIYKALYLAQSIDGTDVDARIAEFATKRELLPDVREILIRDVLRLRKNPAVVPTLMSFARSTKDKRSAVAALKAVKFMAGDEQFDPFLEVVVTSNEPEVSAAAEATVGEIIKKSKNRTDLSNKIARLYEDSVDANARLALLRLLGRCGTTKALEIVKESLGSPDPANQIAAVTALGAWADDSAFPTLIQFISSCTNETVRPKAFDAAIRFVSQPAVTGDSAAAKKLWSELNTVAKTRGEQQSMIYGLVNFDDAWAVKLIEDYKASDDGQVADLAVKALDKITDRKRVKGKK